MKKLICMVLALVLLMGAMTLPASAEDAAGKIYKLPGGYADFVGMGGGVMVVGKTVGEEDGEPIIKYGALDYFGNTVVEFEYDYAYAPDASYGAFLAGKIDYETFEIEEYIIGQDTRPISVKQFFGIDGYYYGALKYDAGVREISYIVMDPDTGVFTIYRKSTNTTETLFEHTCSDKVSTIVAAQTDGYRYAYSDGSTMIWTNGSQEVEFVAENENQMVLPLGFDFSYLYYCYTNFDPETFEATDTVLMRADIEANWSDDLTDRFGAVDIGFDLSGNVAVGEKMILVNDQGKLGYVNPVDGIETGYIFDAVHAAWYGDYIPVEIDGRATYYTLDGKPTEAYFMDCSNFAGGMAFVTDENGETYAIDSTFEKVSENTVDVGDSFLAYYKDGFLITYGSRYEIYQLTNDPNFHIFGDVSKDGLVDVADILQMKNAIMRDDNSDAMLAVADLNADGRVDVADILELKALIMSA